MFLETIKAFLEENWASIEAFIAKVYEWLSLV